MPEYRVQRFKEKCLDARSSLREAGSGQMRTRASTPEISEQRSFRRAKSAAELREAIARSTSRLNKGSWCQNVTARLTADAQRALRSKPLFLACAARERLRAENPSAAQAP